MPHIRAVIFGLFSLLFGFSASAQERPTSPPSGWVNIDEAQFAFIAAGSAGGGTLKFGGRSYPFRIGGLGAGGIGVSRLSASGAVYGLNQLSDFPGAYVEIRSGWAFGDQGKGRLWLKNAKGVLLKLEGTREGMQLAMGASGILIELQ
jgi:hypothetical protein